MARMTDNSIFSGRAVLIDVYQTLLEVGPPPADAGLRWCALWTEMLHLAPRLSLEDVGAATEEIIRRHHAAVRGLGIAWPEVFWPDVIREVLPELNRLGEAPMDDFLFRHGQLQRSVRLMPGAAPVLRALADSELVLGLVSNAQAYTLRELDVILGEAGLGRSLFRDEFSFWSFRSGFSKPDPHVFRSLTVRLRAEGIGPDQILMVGDRQDNDVDPAQAQGWRTWRLTTGPSVDFPKAGNWEQLGRFVVRSRL
jgi:FMN phosphatase YigB (HAD superfamily)